jgi:hypothetical protein
MEEVLHVAHWCFIVSFILSIHIAFYQRPCALNSTIEYGMLSAALASYRRCCNSQRILAQFLPLLPIPLRDCVMTDYLV